MGQCLLCFRSHSCVHVSSHVSYKDLLKIFYESDPILSLSSELLLFLSCMTTCAKARLVIIPSALTALEITVFLVL